MSCYPKCPVPNFLLPKNLRTDRQTTDCIERCSDPKCTAYETYAILPQSELCMNPELDKLMRCQACQEQQMNRMMANQQDQYECYLQKYLNQGPEIPFIWKPERPKLRFIKHGFIVDDCFPQDIRKNACNQRAAWKKKVKAWIKDLSDHYNKKVKDTNEKTIEDYIRLNLVDLTCHTHEKLKCPPPPPKPGCVMVSMHCGRCPTDKKKSRH